MRKTILALAALVACPAFAQEERWEIPADEVKRHGFKKRWGEEVKPPASLARVSSSSASSDCGISGCVSFDCRDDRITDSLRRYSPSNPGAGMPTCPSGGTRPNPPKSGSNTYKFWWDRVEGCKICGINPCGVSESDLDEYSETQLRLEPWLIPSMRDGVGAVFEARGSTHDFSIERYEPRRAITAPLLRAVLANFSTRHWYYTSGGARIAIPEFAKAWRDVTSYYHWEHDGRILTLLELRRAAVTLIVGKYDTEMTVTGSAEAPGHCQKLLEKTGGEWHRYLERLEFVALDTTGTPEEAYWHPANDPPDVEALTDEIERLYDDVRSANVQLEACEERATEGGDE